MTLPINRVQKLYYQDGLSAYEVAEKLGVSVWQIIKYMKKNDLPKRTPSESNKLKYERQKPSFNLKRTLTIEEEKLKIAALMLYWAEGCKSDHRRDVDFVNSDPQMILLFLKFLRDICRIDENRLRILLYCYQNQNINNLLDFWSKLTKIPKSQFQKPYVRKDFNPNGRIMINGLVHIRYNDKKLFRQIIKWINQYKEF